MRQTFSDKFDIVIKSLMNARKEMDTVKKDSTNPFHKSKYASLGSYIDACEEALTKNGLILIPCVNMVEGDNLNAILVCTLMHADSGQWIQSYIPLLNIKGDCQGLGSAITYMRRYSLASMLNLCPEDDDGNKACKPPEKNTIENPQKNNNKSVNSTQKINQQQINILIDLQKKVTDKNISDMWNNINNEYKINTKNTIDIPFEAFERCKNFLNLCIDVNKKKADQCAA